MTTIRNFIDLQNISSFLKRYEYLRLGGVVGETTFGFDRYLNQKFYKSRQWLQSRDQVLIRDRGCDLGMMDYEIKARPVIHHMNPITINDVLSGNPKVFDPEFLVWLSSNSRYVFSKISGLHG